MIQIDICKNLNKKRGFVFYVVFAKNYNWLKEKWLGTIEYSKYKNKFISTVEENSLPSHCHNQILDKLKELNQEHNLNG